MKQLRFVLIKGMLNLIYGNKSIIVEFLRLYIWKTKLLSAKGLLKKWPSVIQICGLSGQVPLRSFKKFSLSKTEGNAAFGKKETTYIDI